MLSSASNIHLQVSSATEAVNACDPNQSKHVINALIELQQLIFSESYQVKYLDIQTAEIKHKLSELALKHNKQKSNTGKINIASTKALETLTQKKIEIENHAKQSIADLRNEFISMAHEPKLQEALELWGSCRNSQGCTNNGKGYNAGVIHYFEYRTIKSKNQRFKKFADQDLSLASFIKTTLQIKPLIRATQDSVTPKVKFVIADESDNQRCYLLSETFFILAFQKPEEPLRILSMLPVQNFEKTCRRLQARIALDLNSPNESHRFNALHGTKSLIFNSITN